MPKNKNSGEKALLSAAPKSGTAPPDTGNVPEDRLVNGVYHPEDIKFIRDFHYSTDRSGGMNVTKYVGKDSVVRIPARVFSKNITGVGRQLFYECDFLEKVTIPETVTNIDDMAFFGCSALKEINIPPHLERIGRYAFYGCKSIERAALPDTVTEIAPYAFAGCSALIGIDIPQTSKVFRSVKGVLFNKAKTELVAYPAGRTVIYRMPPCVTVIREGAFACSTNVRFVYLSENLKEIGKNAFYGCTGIGKLTLTDSIRVIGDYAFAGCNIRYMTIPSGVEKIGECVFYGCESLSRITLPPTVTVIEGGAFMCCRTLRTITCGNGRAHNDEEDNEETENVPEDADADTADDGSTDGGGFAADENSADDGFAADEDGGAGYPDESDICGVTGIFPKNVCRIGRSAFEGTLWIKKRRTANRLVIVNGILIDAKTARGRVVIPDIVTKINSGAFSGPHAIERIVIPDSVKSIEDGAFCSCRYTEFEYNEKIYGYESLKKLYDAVNRSE